MLKRLTGASTLLLFWLVTMLLVPGPGLRGQAVDIPRTDIRTDPQLALANVAFEPLGPGDLVYVSVADCPELTRSYRISAEGDLRMPLLHQRVHAAGIRLSDLEETISKAVADEHILVSPSVSISVLEYRSRPVNVVGAVKHSVTFQALGNVKLLDAIARADGLAAEAGPEILVFQASDPNPTPDKIRHIPIKLLLAGADPSLNIPLHGGEEIRVPEAAKLYIVGNVKNPGTYALNETGNSSVLKALALSQGLLPYSQKTAYVYRLVPGQSQRKEISVPLDDIVHRRAADFPLEANDILYIQDNSRKRLTASVVDRITGFGSATTSGLIIWKH